MAKQNCKYYKNNENSPTMRPIKYIISSDEDFDTTSEFLLSVRTMQLMHPYVFESLVRTSATCRIHTDSLTDGMTVICL